MLYASMGKFAIVAADVLQKMMPNDGEANFGTFCAVVVQNMSRATIARIMPLISTLPLRSTSDRQIGNHGGFYNAPVIIDRLVRMGTHGNAIVWYRSSPASGRAPYDKPGKR